MTCHGSFHPWLSFDGSAYVRELAVRAYRLYVCVRVQELESMFCFYQKFSRPTPTTEMTHLPTALRVQRN